MWGTLERGTGVPRRVFLLEWEQKRAWKEGRGSLTARMGTDTRPSGSTGPRPRKGNLGCAVNDCLAEYGVLPEGQGVLCVRTPALEFREWGGQVQDGRNRTACRGSLGGLGVSEIPFQPRHRRIYCQSG
jgi:hypothetical protein